MQTREATDFWGLHKNMNCAFPLNAMNVATVLEGKIVLFVGSAKIPELLLHLI